MAILNKNSMVFNLAGGAVLVTVIGYMAFDMFRSSEVAPCTTRYPAGRQFALDGKDGRGLTSIELQGRSGNREWGLLQNARVVAGGKSAFSKVLAVKLAKTENEDDINQNGIGFDWSLQELGKAKSVCLSYSAGFPKDFEFKEPGHLPGLYGAANIADVDNGQVAEAFAARVGWGQAGDVGIEFRGPGYPAYWDGSPSRHPWPKDRWVRIEQEIVLNEGGYSDGTMRLWVDGKLRVEGHNMHFRIADDIGISGVLSDVRYARTASDPATIHLSPFVVQWQ